MGRFYFKSNHIPLSKRIPFIQLYLQPLLFHCDLLAKQSKPIRADDYALRRDKEQNDNGY
jgi:hypothetical protein